MCTLPSTRCAASDGAAGLLRMNELAMAVKHALAAAQPLAARGRKRGEKVGRHARQRHKLEKVAEQRRRLVCLSSVDRSLSHGDEYERRTLEEGWDLVAKPLVPLQHTQGGARFRRRSTECVEREYGR
eukprot:6210261-Pleurochrysis_carterae.AAC.1